MNCTRCKSSHIQKDGNHNGYQRYKCMECKRRFDGEKYEGQNSFVIHFNTKLKKTDRNYLTRENYCIPTKEVDYKNKKNIKLAINFINKHKMPPFLCPRYYYEIPNKIFQDNEHFTNEFVELHYKACMENFDLNMKFFSNLNYDEFDKYLMEFVKKNKFIEIKDLNEVNYKKGIYILVLDKYKQVYIGKCESEHGIKQRILQHWSKRKDFGHLLNGDVETSILSIDSFGALDTTRIFYKKLERNMNTEEKNIVNRFKKEYRLNRVEGGINEEESATIRNMRLLSTIQKRKLK